MKAKHIPLLIAITTVAAAAWYFIMRKKNSMRTATQSTTKVNNSNTTAAGSSTNNSPAQTTNTNVWRKATPIIDSNWAKVYIEPSSTSVEYKEIDGTLYVRGQICLKKEFSYKGYDPNQIVDSHLYTFPATIKLEQISTNSENRYLSYATLFVSNEGGCDYFGSDIPTNQFVLNFAQHDDADGCKVFYFAKS